VSKVKRVSKVKLEQRVKRALQAKRELKAQLVPKGNRDLLAKMVPKAQLVLPVKKVQRAILDRLAQLAQVESRVVTAQLVKQVLRVKLDQKENKAQQVLRA